MRLHYQHICLTFFAVTYIFFDSFLLKTSTWYNPYVNCFYDNRTEVGQLIPEEATRPEDRVTCFIWSLDIGEATGQVTATLAFTWAVVSAFIYAQLHCGLIVKKCLKNKERRKFGVCGTCALVLAELTIYIVCLGAMISTIVITSKKLIPDNVSSTQLYLQIMLLASIQATSIGYAINVTKEPENYIDFCQRVVRANAEKPAEVHRIRLEMQRETLTKELTELEKLLKKVEEQEKSDTHRQKRQQSRTRDLDISETLPLLEWQRLEENETPNEQNQAQEQYKKNRTNVEKDIREVEQDLENTTIPEMKGLWKDAIDIEEKSFERQKAKLKLDIKKNRLKQDKALGIETEDDSIEEEEKEYNKYPDLDQREAECQEKKSNLVENAVKKIFELKFSLKNEKISLKKERQRLGQKERDDINWEKELCELDIEKFRLQEERIKLIGANVLREMAEWECKMALAKEAAFYMTEEEMKKITEAAFYRVMLCQDKELPPHTTDPVLLENLSLPYMLTEDEDRLAY